MLRKRSGALGSLAGFQVGNSASCLSPCPDHRAGRSPQPHGCWQPPGGPVPLQPLPTLDLRRRLAPSLVRGFVGLEVLAANLFLQRSPGPQALSPQLHLCRLSMATLPRPALTKAGPPGPGHALAGRLPRALCRLTPLCQQGRAGPSPQATSGLGFSFVCASCGDGRSQVWPLA